MQQRACSSVHAAQKACADEKAWEVPTMHHPPASSHIRGPALAIDLSSTAVAIYTVVN